MNRRVLCVAGAAVLSVGVDCGRVLDIVQPEVVTVRLVNDSDFNVQVELYLGEPQELPREALTELGTKLEYTIVPGDTATFFRSCDDLQAIVLDRARLMVIGQVGPEADTDVLRDGNDFHCGDTIVFTFDHGALFADFNVQVSVQPRYP